MSLPLQSTLGVNAQETSLRGEAVGGGAVPHPAKGPMTAMRLIFEPRLAPSGSIPFGFRSKTIPPAAVRLASARLAALLMSTRWLGSGSWPSKRPAANFARSTFPAARSTSEIGIVPSVTAGSMIDASYATRH